MAEYDVVQILDMEDSYGEDKLNKALSEFLCPLNGEIESFLKKNAVDFSRRKMSITHLVVDEEGEYVAYFTLAHKPVLVKADMLSKTMRRKMERHAKYDAKSDSYTVSAFLIAQLGKNYAVKNGHGISGGELMDLVFDRLEDVQHEIGGGVVFLECEDREKLMEFYCNERNAFRRFGERDSDVSGDEYIQLLRLL